ncbi:hypothetical protein CPB86DRAFT_102550 [Serendipita vermifera]|nr:hypothetical protein CPB86DRAFT_102550 [Serendipita vermifera]
MPKVPPFATAQVAHQYGPVDSFLLRPNVNSGSSTRASHANGELRDQVSILDTVFISQRSQRAVYATTSSGAVTSLWRVSTNGAMTQIAKIDWDYELPVGQGETSAGGIGDGSLRGGQSSSKPKKASTVTFGGKMVKVDDFLKKGKGWFASDPITDHGHFQLKA